MISCPSGELCRHHQLLCSSGSQQLRIHQQWGGPCWLRAGLRQPDVSGLSRWRPSMASSASQARAHQQTVSQQSSDPCCSPCLSAGILKPGADYLKEQKKDVKKEAAAAAATEKAGFKSGQAPRTGKLNDATFSQFTSTNVCVPYEDSHR